MKAEELHVLIARTLWDEHFESENSKIDSKDSCEEQVYQLELLRARLAELTIRVRSTGCQFRDLQRELFRVVR